MFLAAQGAVTLDFTCPYKSINSKKLGYVKLLQYCSKNQNSVVETDHNAVMLPKDTDGVADNVDPDQTAPVGAVSSGSALFAKTYLSQYLEINIVFISLFA